MVSGHWSRRNFLAAAGVAGSLWLAGDGVTAEANGFRLARFEADCTPPLGHPLIGGLRGPATSIADRLSGRGVVLLGAGKPLVICALDWCELRNDAYDACRDAIAASAGTDRERVLLSCIHQHDAPYFDLTAQKLLDEAGLAGAMFDPAFFRQKVEQLSAAVSASLAKAEALTHIGVGAAAVAEVACNRRVVGVDGKPRFNRYSFVRDSAVRDAPDGEIDPQLKQLVFYDGEQPLAEISCYATHPMSYYGNGEVSGDFPALARQMRERETPGVLQIYVTGCSGDVVAAKYNDGTPAGRRRLAEQLYRGMQDAAAAVKRLPLERITFRNARLELPPPDSGPLAIDALEKTIANASASNSDRIHAAMGLSYRRRCDRGQAIDLPAIDFGPAQYAVLPAELFVGYQLAANRMRPDQLVLTAGFCECAPGYIPTDQTRREGFVEEHGYCWVQPEVEATILKAMRKALAANESGVDPR